MGIISYFILGCKNKNKQANNKNFEIGLSNDENSSFPGKQKARSSCFTASCILLGFHYSLSHSLDHFPYLLPLPYLLLHLLNHNHLLLKLLLQ